MKMEKVTRSIVKRRYLPSSGTAREVGGIISASSKKNTVSDSRIEIHRVTLKYATVKREQNISFRNNILGYLPFPENVE